MIVDTEDPHALATDWWAGTLGLKGGGSRPDQARVDELRVTPGQPLGVAVRSTPQIRQYGQHPAVVVGRRW
jgi:hypothetical protein